MNESEADAFADLLKVKANGWALFNPYHEGVVGDCGLLDDGRFTKLFNVFRAPDGLPSIPNPTRTEFRSQPRYNADLHWRATANTDWNVNLEITTPLASTVEVGFGFKVSRSKGAAAFLAPGGTTRQVETYNEKRRFEEYLLHNYSIIRAMHPYKDLQTLVILQGATLAPSWCRGLVRSQGHAFEGFVSIDIAPLLPTCKVGLGHSITVQHPWDIESGPVAEDPEPINQWQTIVVQPVAMRFRDKIRAPFVSSFATPANGSPSSSPDAQDPSAGTGLGGTRGTHSAAPSTSPSGSSSQGTGGQQNTTLHTFDQFSSGPSSTQLERIWTSPQTANEGASDLESPFDDVKSSRNAIEILLDSYLDANEDVDAVVANWDVLHAVWSSHQRSITSPGFSFIPIRTNGHECVGILNINDTSATEELQPDEIYNTYSVVNILPAAISQLTNNRAGSPAPQRNSRPNIISLDDNSQEYAHKHTRRDLEDNLKSLKPSMPTASDDVTIASSRRPPPMPALVHGREKEINQLVPQILLPNSAPIGIVGPGGIGKTTLALKVLHHPRTRESFSARRYFVSCEDATSPDDVLARLAYKIGAKLSRDTPIWEAVIKTLRSNERTLLVIDNFESIWSPTNKPMREAAEVFLAQLAVLDEVTILVTTRGNQLPEDFSWANAATAELDTLSSNAARRVFCDLTCLEPEILAAEPESSALTQLLREVDFVPLAITLLSRLDDLPSSLLREWLEYFTEGLETDRHDGTRREISVDVSIRISLAHLPPETAEIRPRQLLAVCGQLPGGLSVELLNHLHSSIPNIGTAAGNLLRHSLVYAGNLGELQMLSPVRHHVSHNFPMDDMARFVVERFSQPGNTASQNLPAADQPEGPGQDAGDLIIPAQGCLGPGGTVQF